MTESPDPRNNPAVQPEAQPQAPVQPQPVAQTQPQGQAPVQPDAYAQQAAQAQAQANAQAQAAAAESYRQQVYQAYSQQPQAPYAQPSAPAHAAAKPSAGKTFAAGFAGAALAVVLGLGGFAGCQALTGAADQDGQSSSSSTGSSSASTIGDIVVDGEDTTLAEAVAAKALPSIASIDTYQRQSSSMSGMFGREGTSSDSDSALTELGLGSGVVISEDGYIITNYHVIEGADEVHATVAGVEYVAEVVGSDPSSDIAVLKVDAQGLDAIEVGSSSDLEVGQWVMTLGNPFGLENSVSTGVVSAMQRSSTMTGEDGSTVIYPNMIQTDAAINPGNSGGALVDANGDLIGINTLITSYSGSSSMVGFAIPIDYAMGIVDQIIAGETPTHAQLGVSMATLTPDAAAYYGLPVDSGVLVANVYEGTAAEEAGLQRGDVIVSFDGEAVTDASELMLDVREHAVGDTVELEVVRDGKQQTVNVTLGSDESSQSSNGWGYGEGSGSGLGNGFWGN